jgi:hypothetical protein
MGADWRKRASYEYDAGLADRRGTHPLVGSDPSCRHRHPRLPHSRTPSRLAGIVLVAPHFCSGPAASRSGSQRLGSPAATLQEPELSGAEFPFDAIASGHPASTPASRCAGSAQRGSPWSRVRFESRQKSGSPGVPTGPVWPRAEDRLDVRGLLKPGRGLLVGARLLGVVTL